MNAIGQVTSENSKILINIVNNWLVRLTHDLISLVNDNHVDNNLKVIWVYVWL